MLHSIAKSPPTFLLIHAHFIHIFCTHAQFLLNFLLIYVYIFSVLRFPILSLSLGGSVALLHAKSVRMLDQTLISGPLTRSYCIRASIKEIHCFCTFCRSSIRRSFPSFASFFFSCTSSSSDNFEARIQTEKRNGEMVKSARSRGASATAHGGCGRLSAREELL